MQDVAKINNLLRPDKNDEEPSQLSDPVFRPEQDDKRKNEKEGTIDVHANCETKLFW